MRHGLLHSRKRGDERRGGYRPAAAHSSALAAELTARLRSLVPQEATERDLRSDVAVLEGRDAATTVCQEAERFGADLICIGSRGHSGLTAAVLGSVAQKIMSHTSKPVMVVRMPTA